MDKLFLRGTDLITISNEYTRLSNITEYKSNTRLGNIIVDYFTLHERLHTKCKVGISFIEFWRDFDFYSQKPYVKKMLDYYEREGKYRGEPERIALSVFRLYFGSIQIFRPIVAMEIYSRFPDHKHVLDPTMGWGGRLVGGALRALDSYTGIDSNRNLQKPYSDMTAFLQERSTIKINTHFCDAVYFDYSTVFYNMVFTSPPYETKEIYRDMSIPNNWYFDFYEPLFRNTWEYLQPGGVYILNIPESIYERYAIPALGQSHEVLPFVKYSRNNKYRESFYIWFKQSNNIVYEHSDIEMQVLPPTYSQNEN